MLYEGFSATDNHGSVYLAGTRFSGAIFALPLMASRGVTLTAGVSPYSRVNYNIQLPTTDGAFQYTLHYRGEGGLARGHLGVSGLIGSSLSLGLKLDYYFGTLRNSVEQNFAATQFTSSGVERSTRLNGVGATAGAVYSGLGSLIGLPQGQSLAIAAVFSTSSRLTAAEERYYTYTTDVTSHDTLIGSDGTFDLPLMVAGGIAWQSERLTLATDYTMQRWTDARANGSSLASLRDSYRWSAGVEFVPKREPSAPFFQRLAYRGGVYYDATYYRVNDVAINEYGIAAGFAASLFGETRFALGASYGFRGTTDQQLQKDKILRISLTLNVGELWFVKPPEE
jgi:hypothetical protein